MASSDEEDLDCPLCMEEIDVTDRYFKPCPCGYQICRFCWNHIKENLNGLCPACRRPYSEDTVEFKPVPPEEMARIKAIKKRKERERKEQDQLSRRNLTNAKAVQKTLIYVVGLSPKVTTSETVLKGPEYFGQFGKIVKVILNRRPHAHTPVVSHLPPNTGVYITYARKEDAARAIESVDGNVYDGKLVRATYGTTRYCSNFLKGQQCPVTTCQFLHEHGDEPDAFAAAEMGRMQVRERNPRRMPFPTVGEEKKEEEEGSALPATASWARPVARPAQSSAQHSPAISSSTVSTAATSLRAPEPEPVDSWESIAAEPLTTTPPPAIPSVTESSARAKAKQTTVELPPGLSGPPSPVDEAARSVPSSSTAAVVEEEHVLGSSALDETNDLSARSTPRVESPHISKDPTLLHPTKDDGVFGFGIYHDEDDFKFSLSAMGYVLHPKYVGPFDPFRENPLAVFAGLSAMLAGEKAKREGELLHDHGLLGGHHESDSVRSSSRQSDNPQKSRFERFFGGVGEVEAYETSVNTEKKEEAKTVQESFRAMFPNVNVSFATGSLSDAEARWGKSFSPSKLAAQDSQNDPTVWAQGQSGGAGGGGGAYPSLRGQQQPNAATFSSAGLRGLGGGQYGTPPPGREQLLQQQQQQQQQFLPNNVTAPPQLMSQYQQYRLPSQQQQQPPAHFPTNLALNSHLLPHQQQQQQQQQPQDDILNQVLQSQLRQELQLRAAGRGGQQDFRDPKLGGGAPGFEARTRLGAGMGYQQQQQQQQQEWNLSAAVGASGMGGGYGGGANREKDAVREELIRQYLREREVRQQEQQQQQRQQHPHPQQQQQRDQDRRDLVAERVAAMMARNGAGGGAGAGAGEQPPGIPPMMGMMMGRREYR